MTYTVLLVDCNPDTRVKRAELLSSAGYSVVAAGTFSEALDRLSCDPPDLLITDVRLGEFNGLHLVVRSRRERPHIGALVIHDAADLGLEAEATRLGAASLLKQTEPTALFQTIRRLLSERASRMTHAESGRRWARFHPVRPVEVLIADRPGRVVDMAFGGLGLLAGHVPAGHESGRMSVRFPLVDLIVEACLVWCRSSGSGDEWRCGFKLLSRDADEAAGWREFALSLMSANP